MKVYEIGENLYVSGHPKLADVSRLRDGLGVNEIVTCSKKLLDLQVCLQLGIHPFYYPLVDGKKVQINAIRGAVGIVSYLLEGGRTVLVHCLAGRNRSVLVAGLAEARRQGWSGTEALEHVRRVRPNSIHNPYFEQYMRSLP